MGNIWRSFWYVGIIILLSALNKNGNDAFAGITKKKRNRRKGRTPLILSKDKSKTFIPQLPWQSIYGEGTFYWHLGSTRADIPSETWMTKQISGPISREDYFTICYPPMRKILFHERYCPMSGDDLMSRKYILLYAQTFFWAFVVAR